MRNRPAIAIALAGMAVLTLSATGSAADKDKVRGTATFDVEGGSQVWLQAKSDADGANPSGTYRIDEAGLQVEAEVVCLYVDGPDAVVGLTITSSSDVSLLRVGVLHYVHDAGGPGVNDASISILGLPGSLCDDGVPPLEPLKPVQSGNWVVQDN